MCQKYCVLHAFSQRRSIVGENHRVFFQQNCDFEGLVEEREQTDTPTDAPTHALIVWRGRWVGGRVRWCVL